MIDYKELRIGNWIERDGRPVKVEVVGWRDLWFSGGGIVEFKDLHPIPLTPEILEKAGFVKENDGYMVHDIPEWTTKLRGCIDPECKFYFSLGGPLVDDYRFFHIKHVHQLQNFYFSITNEELQIEL